MDEKNCIKPEGIVVSDELKRYFAELAANHGIDLSEGQKAWYALKKDGDQGLGRLMKREHPSTPEEAFEQSVEGAVFGKELELARTQGRVGFVPYDETYPVYTFWDLGVGHPTCVLFVQFIGNKINIIDYHEEANRGITHHCKQVKDRPYVYGGHYVPHDGNKRSRETGTPLIDTMSELLGIDTVTRIPRISHKGDSIAAGQMVFNKCHFDAKKTDRLIKCLSFYRYEWNDEENRYSDMPVDDWTADGADAYQQLGLVYLKYPELRAALQLDKKFGEDRDSAVHYDNSFSFGRL
jgi:hypothetical protein